MKENCKYCKNTGLFFFVFGEGNFENTGRGKIEETIVKVIL